MSHLHAEKMHPLPVPNLGAILSETKVLGGAMAKESWTDITAEITVNGSYYISKKDKTITVRSPYGSKTTKIGGLRPEVLAKFMLRELAQDER